LGNSTETNLSYFLLCKSHRNCRKNGGAIIAAPFFLIGAARAATGFALQPNSPATKTSRNRLKEQLDALNRELRRLLDGSNGVAPEKKCTGLKSNVSLQGIAISQRGNTMR
jgi:hypothetical protein